VGKLSNQSTRHLVTVLLSVAIFALNVWAADVYCRSSLASIPFRGLDRAEAFWVLPIFVVAGIHTPLYDLVSLLAYRFGYTSRFEELILPSTTGRAASRLTKITIGYTAGLAVAFGALMGWIRLTYCPSSS
jgi:hypothetical protein